MRSTVTVETRAATDADLESLTDCALRFLAASPYAHTPVDRHDLQARLRKVSEIGFLDVAVVDERVVGFLAGMTSAMWFTDVPVATELAWWVDPEHQRTGVGLRLIRSFERWAREAGVARIYMADLASGSAGRIYESRGYRLIEQAYTKEIG